MGEWLTYLVPWWIWAALAAVAVVGVMSVLASLLGTKRAIKIGAGLAAGLGALVALGRARQQGWRDREAKGERDAQRAIEDAERARRSVWDDLTSRPGRLRDDDGHRRD